MLTEVHGFTYHCSNKDMAWGVARKWCQKKYTDLAGNKNLKDIIYLNKTLPPEVKHCWIGLYKEAHVWFWVETEEEPTEKELNWAPGEPNNMSSKEDCVEIYLNSRNYTGKLNDDHCSNYKRALCYKVSCQPNLCGPDEVCMEQHEGYMCKNKTAVRCRPLQVPEGGNVSCSRPSEDLLYGSSCSFSCADGHQLQGASSVICMASAQWSAETPICKAVPCPSVQPPQNGNVTYEDSSGDLLYGSNCSFSCDPGFILHGSEVMTCGKSGDWIGERPVCQAVQCRPLQVPEGGSVNCSRPSEDLFYNSSCSFSCADGHQLQGASNVICMASAQWSAETPTCKAVPCPSVQPPQNGNITYEDSSGDLLYGSNCSFSCDPGFILHGSEVMTCGKSGDWIGERPVCQAVQCRPLQVPEGGSVNCSRPSEDLFYNSSCSFSCADGHQLQGASNVICMASAQWSAETPICKAVPCPSVQPPQNGNVTCANSSGDLLYSSTCSFSCDPGFILHGSEVTTCGKSGDWIGERPLCQAHPDPTLNPTLLVVAIGGAAGLTGCALAVWIVKRLQQKAKKYHVNRLHSPRGHEFLIFVKSIPPPPKSVPGFPKWQSMSSPHYLRDLEPTNQLGS
ncbi:P-selectin-like [Megalops cyprinoides]|uniref:P-selectin-like n=1 Tax=Megalops cyprinoides TaxID=118141 RepID=UPI001864543D|nr:P-selectin-like [Megalops cyprinoides]